MARSLENLNFCQSWMNRRDECSIAGIEFASSSSLVSLGGGAGLASFWLGSIGCSPLSLLGGSCWKLCDGCCLFF